MREKSASDISHTTSFAHYTMRMFCARPSNHFDMCWHISSKWEKKSSVFPAENESFCWKFVMYECMKDMCAEKNFNNKFFLQLVLLLLLGGKKNRRISETLCKRFCLSKCVRFEHVHWHGKPSKSIFSNDKNETFFGSVESSIQPDCVQIPKHNHTQQTFSYRKHANSMDTHTQTRTRTHEPELHYQSILI